MPVTAPYRRNVRQFVDGDYSKGGRWQYILHDRYAQSPEHYIRAFLVMQGDLMRLFESVEPAHQNLNAYSFRIHEILMRAAIEVEANCKAILTENGYAVAGNWNVEDYMKVNASHRLSSYEVKLPVWNGAGSTRNPFAAWAASQPLPWYQAYNRTKHDRHNRFHEATLQHALDAVCGLVVLLASQFQNHDFAPSDWSLSVGGPNDGMESSIGGYFRIRYPNDFPNADRYDFNWQALKMQADPFRNYTYPH